MTTQPILLDFQTPQAKASSIAATVGWTLLGVGALFLAGKGITALGTALGMPYGCWQLTGLRAAASASIVGGLVATRRGQLALFGVLYAAILPLSHSASSLLIVSAILAGVVAWLLQARIANRPLAVLGATLAFNVLLTLSGFVAATQAGLHDRLGFVNYGSGLGMRLIATMLVAGAFALGFKLLRR